MALIDIVNGKQALQTGLFEKWAPYSSPGRQGTRQTSGLAIIGKSEVGRSAIPGWLSGGLRKVKMQCQRSDWSYSDLKHSEYLHFSNWQWLGDWKHYFGETLFPGCLTYDIIALWPDLTWSFFCQKCRKGCNISSIEIQRDLPSASAIIKKNHGREGCIPPCAGDLRLETSGVYTASQLLAI